MRQLLSLHPDSPCFAAAHIEVEVARPHADQFGVVLYRDRQDRATSACRLSRRPRAATSFGGIPASRHLSALRRAPGITNSTLRLRHNGRPIDSAATEAGCVWRPRSARLRSKCNRAPTRYTLQASLELDRLSGLPRNALWRLGLSALIEDTSGRKSYWALAHPPGKPDFHHADCFAHEFSPAVQP